MGLLTRAVQKIFGSTGGTGEFGQIGSKAAGAPTTTKNLETMQGLSEYLLGMNAIVSDQGTSVLPYLEDINSLFFLTTSQLAYLMQSGVPEWDDATEYYLGVSVVLHDGILWKDIYGTGGTPNLNFSPTTNLDKWQPISIDSALVDSGAADAYVLAPVAGTYVAAYYDQMKVTFKASATNTGASTVDIDSIGAKNITLPDGSALVGGEIIAVRYTTLVYNLASDRFEIILFNTLLKTYNGDGTDFDITSAQAGFSTTGASGIPYQTSDGKWRLRVNGSTEFTAASISIIAMAIGGVVFSNSFSRFYQAFSVYNKSGTELTTWQGFVTPNAADITMRTGVAFYSSQMSFSMDVELESKPTWAD